MDMCLDQQVLIDYEIKLPTTLPPSELEAQRPLLSRSSFLTACEQYNYLYVTSLHLDKDIARIPSKVDLVRNEPERTPRYVAIHDVLPHVLLERMENEVERETAEISLRPLRRELAQ